MPGLRGDRAVRQDADRSLARCRRDSVTVHVDAPPERVWRLVSDVTNTGRFSPETFEAEWIDGSTGPEVGARFRGHVKRNGRGPTYWTKCTVVAASPARSSPSWSARRRTTR